MILGTTPSAPLVSAAWPLAEQPPLERQCLRHTFLSQAGWIRFEEHPEYVHFTDVSWEVERTVGIVLIDASIVAAVRSCEVKAFVLLMVGEVVGVVLGDPHLK
jgi:hypothetical protein